MSVDKFTELIPPELVASSLEALGIAWSEMEVVQEALHQRSSELIGAREVLESERQRYQDFFEFAPDGCLITDADGTIREANRAAAALLNVSQQLLVGLSLITFMAESEHLAFSSQLTRLRQEKRAQGTWELHLQPRSGESFDATLTVATVYDSKGNLIALRLYIRALPNRQRTQSALHESEERFRFLAQGFKDYAVFRLDLDGRVVSWNAESVSILGYQAADILGQHFSCLFTPEDIQCGSPEQDLRTTVAEERVEEDRWYVRSDGTRFWGSGVLTTIRDQAGTLLGFSKIVRDMTSHKYAEQKIQEQAALLDVATDAILVQDLNNHILFWNKGAERLYDWKADEAKDKNVSELLYKDIPGLEDALVSVAKAGEWQGELHQITKSGQKIIVNSRWTLVRDQAKQPTSILSVSTDITAKKQLEAQFLRAQRLESVGTLASGIAHDLNNVLTPILLSAQLLQMLIKDERSQRLLQIQETNAKRGAALVKQVLGFVRGVEGKRTVLQLRHLILEIEQIIKETFPKSIEFYPDLSPELWTVFGDATQLHQVLMNLVVNARDAMPKGGTLRLVAENLLIEPNTQINLDAQVGAYIVITVSDTGTGMTPEILDKIFEPFFTSKEIGLGTGLGLSTVLGIITSHGGFVNVYSAVGKGSQFKVYLPAVAETQQQAEELGLPTGRGEWILVVDDEAPICEITKTMLETYNYKVFTANDGIEALALYSEHQDEISVVLTDMMMPLMDGSTTIRALQKLNPQLRIIAVSGLASNDKVAEATGGVKAFLSKPYTVKELLNTINDVLNPTE